jgi:hypothetical protein
LKKYELEPLLCLGPCRAPSIKPRRARAASLRHDLCNPSRIAQIWRRTSGWYAKSQNAPCGTMGSLCSAISFLVVSTISSTRVTPRLSFAAVAATATGELSIPTVGNPRTRAATFVVPLPQNGSSTTPSRAFFRIDIGNSSGNIVKYGHSALSALMSSVIRRGLRAHLPIAFTSFFWSDSVSVFQPLFCGPKIALSTGTTHSF